MDVKIVKGRQQSFCSTVEVMGVVPDQYMVRGASLMSFHGSEKLGSLDYL